VRVQEPDPGLLRRAQEGDLDAFEALVRAYQADVWRFARSLVRDRSLADDIAQEALVRAYRFLSGFRGDSKFSSWLFRIVRNCATDATRREGRPPVRFDPTPAPDHQARVEISMALDALPARLREPFLLVEVFGLPYADAANVLQTREGTVKSRVHRARQALIASLTESEEVADGV
jgi:RNA polymerase sigma-70 factor (ECF subfamily)